MDLYRCKDFTANQDGRVITTPSLRATLPIIIGIEKRRGALAFSYLGVFPPPFREGQSGKTTRTPNPDQTGSIFVQFLLYLIKIAEMDTLIINTKNPGNAKLLLELVKKLGEKGKILNKQEQEDFLLGNIMRVEKTGKTVSRDAIMKKLKR